MSADHDVNPGVRPMALVTVTDDGQHVDVRFEEALLSDGLLSGWVDDFLGGWVWTTVPVARIHRIQWLHATREET